MTPDDNEDPPRPTHQKISEAEHVRVDHVVDALSACHRIEAIM